MSKKSNEAQITYRSTKYGILCYGLMVNKPFSSMDCIQCIPGIFKTEPSRRIESFRAGIKTLERWGYIDKVGEDSWCINHNSRVVVNSALNRYRKNRVKFLGSKYMSSVNERLTRVSFSLFSETDKDREDAILDEVARKMSKTLARRSMHRAQREGRG